MKKKKKKEEEEEEEEEKEEEEEEEEEDKKEEEEKEADKETKHDARLDILVQRRDALAAGHAESHKEQPATWHSFLAGDVLRWSRNLLTDESVLLVTKSYSWWDPKEKQLRSHTPQCLSSTKRWEGRSQLSAHRLVQSE